MVFYRIVELFLTSPAGDSLKLEHLKINFEVNYERGKPANALIDVYNLSIETQRKYIQKGTKVRLVAGYKYGGVGNGVIFAGELDIVTRTVESPDVKVSLDCKVGLELMAKPVYLANLINTHQTLRVVQSYTSYRIDVTDLPNRPYDNYTVTDTPLNIIRQMAFDVGCEVLFLTRNRIGFRPVDKPAPPIDLKITDMLLQTPINRTQDEEGELLSLEVILSYRYDVYSTLQLNTSDHKGTVELKTLSFVGDNQDGEFKSAIEAYPVGSRIVKDPIKYREKISFEGRGGY